MIKLQQTMYPKALEKRCVETVGYGLPGADVWVARNIVSDEDVDTALAEHVRMFRKNFPEHTFEVDHVRTA